MPSSSLPVSQKEAQGATRVSLFSLFGLERQKKRKRKLADLLWCDLALADASAEVVLSVFRDHMEARHAWVENKRDARVRADLLCTVQVRQGEANGSNKVFALIRLYSYSRVCSSTYARLQRFHNTYCTVPLARWSLMCA